VRGAHFTAKGTIDSPLDGKGVDLRLTASADDLGGVTGLIDANVPYARVGPLAASGRLHDRDDALGLDELTLEVGPVDAPWAKLSGSIADVVRAQGIRLDLTLDADEAGPILAHAGLEYPNLGSVEGSAHVNDGDGTLGIEDAKLKLGNGDRIDVQLTGSFGDVRDLDEISFEAQVRAEDLRELGALFERDLPSVGPVRFSGKISGSRDASRAKGTLELDATAFSADLGGSFAQDERPHLFAHLRSQHVHLDDLGIAPNPPDADASDAGSKAEESDAGRSLDDPLPFHRLRDVDLVLTLNADRITSQAGLDLRDFRTSAALKDGVLTLHDTASNRGDGSASIDLRIDARSPIPSVSSRGEARHIVPTWLQSSSGAGIEALGAFDLSFALASRGRSLADLASSLGGRVAARIHDGNLATRYGREFVKEFARISIPGLTPRRSTRLDCLELDLAVEAGIANVETLHVDSERVTIDGSGRVDLGSGTYDLQLTPVARDPSLFSITAAVSVTGPLDQPVFKPLARSVATSAVRSIAHTALKPANLLLRPIQSRIAAPESDACDAPFEPVTPPPP
jgi:hypothetical protein